MRLRRRQPQSPVSAEAESETTPRRSFGRLSPHTLSDLKVWLGRPTWPLPAEAPTKRTRKRIGNSEPAVAATDNPGDVLPNPTTDEAISISATPASPSLVGGLITAVLLIAALGSLAAWTGYAAALAHDSQRRQTMYIDVAKQGALNLANINAAHVDSDVQRILESSTGSFHQQFEERSRGFADFVQKAQSTSQATIREAGLESEDGDRARVLVALSVKVSAADTPPDQAPRSWRLRMTVEQIDDGSVKVSDVEFVP
jgi:Mce-associated membrane protein